MEDGETVPQGVSDELFDSMLAFTPHRADELRALLRERRVEVRAVATQHESPLVAIPGEVGVIQVHMPAIKRMMVMAHAYVMAYRAAEQISEAGVRRLYWPDHPNIKQAREMLAWAMHERYRVAVSKEQRMTPPDERLPSDWLPEREAGSADARIAEGVFFSALVVDLHHELAHLTGGHVATEDPEIARRQEREADETAAEWFMGGRPEGDRFFKGALLGLVLSHLYEQFMRLEGFTTDPLHPPMIDRLRRTVAPWIDDPDHAAWAFLAVTLSLHLELANRRHKFDPEREHATFRDMAEYVMDVYEKAGI